MINKIFSLDSLFALLHFLLYYFVLTTLIVSNNINVIIVALFIMIYVKLLYITYNRCILSIVENGERNFIDNSVNISFRVISNDYNNFGLPIQNIEAIFINIGLLIAINKLMILYFLKYNSKFFDNLKFF